MRSSVVARAFRENLAWARWLGRLFAVKVGAVVAGFAAAMFVFIGGVTAAVGAGATDALLAASVDQHILVVAIAFYALAIGLTVLILLAFRLLLAVPLSIAALFVYWYRLLRLRRRRAGRTRI